MCFTETHLDGNIANSDLIIDVHESCIYRKDLNSHSGGLLVYVSDKLVSKRRPDRKLDSVHAIWVEVKYHTSTFFLCNVYRSPATPVMVWNFFNISIERALESNPNIIIVGDLNQYLLLANDNQLANIMSLNNLTNVINKPTRITDTLSTLIDPILVPDTVRVLYSDTLDIANYISDHKATFMTISFMEIFQTCSKRKVWNYARADYVNESSETFTKIITYLISQCIPSKEVTTRPNDRPWFDTETRKHIRHRDRQKHKATKSCRLTDWIKYKKLKNKVNNVKKATKQPYFGNLKDKISNAKSENPKQFWKYVLNLVKTNSTSETIPLLKHIKTIQKHFYIQTKKRQNV